MSKRTYKVALNTRRLSLVSTEGKGGDEIFKFTSKWNGYNTDERGYLADNFGATIIRYNRLSNRKVQKTDDEDNQRKGKKSKPNGKRKSNKR
jgi:hypothetical protein